MVISLSLSKSYCIVLLFHSHLWSVGVEKCWRDEWRVEATQMQMAVLCFCVIVRRRKLQHEFFLQISSRIYNQIVINL